jgi:hypothetical protein
MARRQQKARALVCEGAAPAKVAKNQAPSMPGAAAHVFPDSFFELMDEIDQGTRESRAGALKAIKKKNI